MAHKSHARVTRNKTYADIAGGGTLDGGDGRANGNARSAGHEGKEDKAHFHHLLATPSWTRTKTTENKKKEKAPVCSESETNFARPLPPCIEEKYGRRLLPFQVSFRPSRLHAQMGGRFVLVFEDAQVSFLGSKRSAPNRERAYGNHFGFESNLFLSFLCVRASAKTNDCGIGGELGGWSIRSWGVHENLSKEWGTRKLAHLLSNHEHSTKSSI